MNCTQNLFDNTVQELLKRIYVPIYILLLALTASLIILKSKDTPNYPFYKVKVFLIGILFMIVSDISLNFTGTKYLNNLSFLIIPIISFLTIYQILILKINK